MHKPDLNYLFSRARAISLTSEEERALRANINRRMDERPLVMEHAMRGLIGSRSFLPLSFFKSSRMPLVLALVFLFSGGTVAAAQGALPGSILYPVKININEQMQTLLAVTPSQKASVAADHAAERVKEAETLSGRGELTAQTQAQLKAALSTDLVALQTDLETLRKQDPQTAALIAQNLKGKLHSHNVLLIISGVGTTTADSSLASSTTAGAPAIQLILPVKLHVEGEGGRDSEAASTTASTTLEINLNGHGEIQEGERGDGEEGGSVTASSTIQKIEPENENGDNLDSASAAAALRAHTGSKNHDEGKDSQRKGTEVGSELHLEL